MTERDTEDKNADHVIDVDKDKISADEELFWKVCVFCEAQLGPEHKEGTDQLMRGRGRLRRRGLHDKYIPSAWPKSVEAKHRTSEQVSIVV